MERLIDIPVEKLTIEEMLLRLEPAISSVKTIDRAVAAETDDLIFKQDSRLNPSNTNTPELLAGLRAAYDFYEQMMKQRYSRVSAVIDALRKGLLSREVVAAAAASAYLHPPMRETITLG